MNNYIIYMYTNKVNGKVYIGQTNQGLTGRAGKEGSRYEHCSAFWNAIQKYGWDSFEPTILEENLSPEEANELEVYYISFFKATDKAFGYNIHKGGVDHSPVSEETHKKLSEHMKERWQQPGVKEKYSQLMKEKWADPEYRAKMKKAIQEGKKPTLSEEGRKRISEARKAYIAEHGTPTQGKGHTEEARKKIAESKKGEKNPMYGKHHTQEHKDYLRKKLGTKVQCIETEEIFDSQKQAAAWAGLKKADGIGLCCRGVQQTSGKHPETGQPLHWQYYQEEEIENGS